MSKIQKGDSRRGPVEEPSRPERSVEYARLPRREQLQVLMRDFAWCAEEVGACVYGDRVVVPLGRLRYVWRCVLLENCTHKLAIWNHVSRVWQYEHGVLFLVAGTVSKRAFTTFHEIHFKEKWGWFTCLDEMSRRYPEPTVPLPVNTKDFSLPVLTLSNLAGTHALCSSFYGLLRFLDTDEDTSRKLYLEREAVNDNLRRWLRQGWLISTRLWPILAPPPTNHELRKDEVFDKRSRTVLRRERSERLRNMAQTVLDLSAGRLP